MGRQWPFIWTHPPVEYAHGSVTKTGHDERALGVAGQAGHTAVRSGWDVLVDTQTSPSKACKQTTWGTACEDDTHYTLNSLKSSIACSYLCLKLDPASICSHRRGLAICIWISPSIKTTISSLGTIRCVKNGEKEETALTVRAVNRQQHECNGHAAQ